jgi:hypothetical protein
MRSLRSDRNIIDPGPARKFRSWIRTRGSENRLSMQKFLRAVMIMHGTLFLGCSPSMSPSTRSVTGPHHATMIGLNDEKSFVELTNEPEVADRRNPQPTSIVAYFLQVDGKTPLSPLPTDVKFMIETGRGTNSRVTKASVTPVPLLPEPKSDDPAGAARFVSKPGPYHLLGVRGTLSATISGRGTSTSFSESR